MQREIVIQCPDGQIKNVPLRGDRFTVGRSSAAELCFPDDAGLSRQHMVLDRDGDDWTVQDLGSKNGTLVNNIPLRAKLKLKPGDRITAGHLAIVFDDKGDGARPKEGVVVFETGEADPPSTSTIFTSLEGALSSQTIVDRPGQQGAKQVQALIRAGQELAGRGTLADLFPLILDLAIEGVGAQRGVVMILEGERLEVKANKGEGFRISSAVRDRVINEKASVLVRDAQLDEAFRERMSIVEQKVRTLMAVPLQTEKRTIGLIYVDSPNMFRAFTKDDLSLLTVMANVAAIRIEHARLSEVEEMERRMARELDQAAEIQRSFLPASAPQVPGADLAGYNAACRTVGGDYYDFFTYPNGRVAMVLGDVSGKGMPASLMMMGLQARVQVLADEPQNLAAFMNRAEQDHLQELSEQSLHYVLLLRAGPGHGRAGLLQCGTQSAGDRARPGRCRVSGWRRPAAGDTGDGDLLRISREAGAGRCPGDLQRRRYGSDQRAKTTSSATSGSRQC